MSSTELLTQKIMDEVLTELDTRLDYVSQYKADMGIDIPFSQTSSKYQEGLKSFFIKDLMKNMNISEDKARNTFDKNFKDSMVFDYVCEKGDKDKQDFLAMRNRIAHAPDAKTKVKYSQEFNMRMEQLYQEISPEQKTNYTDKFMFRLQQHHHGNNKMRSELNATLKTNDGFNTNISFENDHGYCLKAIVTSLYEANKKYGCLKFLPQDIELAVHPETFVNELKKDEKYAHHIYASNEKHNIRDLIEKNNIQKGAIVMICSEDGKPRHAMFYTGEQNADGEPLLSGFNGEDKNILASKSKNGKNRKGIILDIHSMLSEDIQRMFPENYHALISQKLPKKPTSNTNSPTTKKSVHPMIDQLTGNFDSRR